MISQKLKVSLVIGFVFFILSNTAVLAEDTGYFKKKELSIEKESYVLFFKKWEQEFPQWLRPGEKLPNAQQEEERWGIKERKGVDIFLGTPSKISSTERDDYFKCINDRSTCSCDNPDQCEQWVTDHCQNKCCSWSNPQGISGLVVKIGNKYNMYAHSMMIFQSDDGLHWKLPKSPLESSPLKLGANDPWGRFGKPYTADNQCYYTESTFRWAGAWPQNAYWYDMSKWQKYPANQKHFLIDWTWSGVFEDENEPDPTKKFKWLSSSSPDGEYNRHHFPQYRNLRLAYSADGLHWREATYDITQEEYQGLTDERKKHCFQKQNGEGYFCYLTTKDHPKSPAVTGGLYNNSDIPHWRTYMEALGGCSYNPNVEDPKFRWKCFGQAHGVDRYPASREIGFIHAPKPEGPWYVSDGPDWPKAIALSFYGHNQNMYFGDETHPNPGPQTHGGWPWVYKGYEFLLYGYLDLRDPARKRTNIRLATSLDGWHYNLIGGTNSALINHKHDPGIIWGAWPIIIGDEIWIYYNGSKTEGAFYYSDVTDWNKRGGLAKIRLDGFTYVSPEKKCSGNQCFLETEPIIVGNLGQGAELFVNANVSPGSDNNLKIEILNASDNQPVAGFSQTEATPITGDSTKTKVSWGTKNNLKELQEKQINQIKLKFYFSTQASNANERPKLYSYHFASAESGNCPSSHLGNLDCDSQGLINEIDLTILLQKWSPQGPVPTPTNHRTADLDNNGKVDETDLTKLLSNWKT